MLLVLGCAEQGTPQASPNEPSSGELVENLKEYDGETVTFRGEVIGEAMVRGDMAWLHINDDAYYVTNIEEGASLGGYNSGMAVWISAEEIGGIAHYGDYRFEGDIVEVTGIFNSACGEHGGDVDIHGAELTVVSPGRRVIDEVKPWKWLLALGLGAIALVLFVIQSAQRRSV